MGQEYKRDPKGYRRSHGVQEPDPTRTTIFEKYKALTIALDILSFLCVGAFVVAVIWGIITGLANPHFDHNNPPLELKIIIHALAPSVFGGCWLIAHFVAKADEGEDDRPAIYDYRLQPFFFGLPVFCLFIYVYMYFHIHLLRE
jgi:hypothetical protein